MKKSIATLFVSLLLVFGCAVAPTSPAQAVFIAKQDYAVALTTAVAYKRLPPCTGTSTVVCSDLHLVDQIQKADDAAYALLNGAEKTVRLGGSNMQLAVNAAQQAVLALSSIVATLAK